MDGSLHWAGVPGGEPRRSTERYYPSLGDDVPRWVQAGRLPEAPAELPIGSEVPVAMWTDDDLGVVLSIAHTGPQRLSGGGLPFSAFWYPVRRSSQGWMDAGLHGGEWPVAFGRRPLGEGPWLLGKVMGHVPPGLRPLVVATGIAPHGLSHVTVRRADGSVTNAPVEPVSGAFLLPLPSADEIESLGLPIAPKDERLRM